MTKCQYQYCISGFRPTVLPREEFAKFMQLLNTHKAIAAAKRYQPIQVPRIIVPKVRRAA